MESDSEKKLIESIYNVTIDPQKYDGFLKLWEDEFLNVPNDQAVKITEKINSKSEIVSDAIENHFFRAFAILELMDGNQKSHTIKQIVEADPLPTFILSKNKNILLSNDAVTNLLNISQGDKLSALNITADDLTIIDKNILGIENIEQDKVLAIIHIQNTDSDTPLLFALSKLHDANSDTDFLRFSGMHTIWNDHIGSIIQNTFNLSDMELDIAKKLVSGKKLAEIAQEKQRSIFTIRTQNKSLFRKTNLKSQSELIRLFALLQNMDYQEKQDVLPLSDQYNPQAMRIKRKNYLTRPNGRKLYYEIYGAAHGEPVLFMHGGISGTQLPQNVIDVLIEKNIKLISPHRAGFGHSDVNPAADKVSHLVDDVLALFEKENIQNCKIVGHLVGAFYAYYIASKLSDRITKLLIIGGAAPFSSIHQINALKPRQRIITYTAKYAPQLLPFLLKSAVAQITQYGAEGFMKALFKDIEPDYAFCKSPETRDIIMNGLQSSFGQGVESVVNDAHYIFDGKWDQIVDDCTMPIDMFHGAEDPAVPIDQVEEFLDNHKNINLNILDGGQMILFQYPEILFEDL